MHLITCLGSRFTAYETKIQSTSVFKDAVNQLDLHLLLKRELFIKPKVGKGLETVSDGMTATAGVLVTGIQHLNMFLSEVFITEWRQQMTTHITDISHAFTDNI